MRSSYLAEMVKLRKRSAMWVLFAAGLVLSLVFGYLLPYIAYATGDANMQTQGVPADEVLAGVLPEAVVANTIGGFPVFAGALALAFGALVAGGEYAWGTVKTLLTQGRGRVALLCSQLLAVASMLMVWVLVIFVASALCSVAIAAAENAPQNWPSALDLVSGLAGGWLVLLMWCLGGVILGVTLRSVALPIGLGIVWVLGVENLVSGVASSLLPGLEPVADLLPGVNAGSLVNAVLGAVPGDTPPGVTDAVSGGRALVTLSIYGLVFALGSLVVLRRRDVV